MIGNEIHNTLSSKEDIAKLIEKAKKDYLACNFRIFELGSEITEEGVFELGDDISTKFTGTKIEW